MVDMYNCPNCGGALENDGIKTYCPYCRRIIEDKSVDLKKEEINNEKKIRKNKLILIIGIIIVAISPLITFIADRSVGFFIVAGIVGIVGLIIAVVGIYGLYVK